MMNKPCQDVSVELTLKQLRTQAIEQIVARARVELPDYARRDLNELTQAVGAAYDNWCESVLNNDFGISQRQSRWAIQAGLEAGRDPAQITRTPWLIYEVTLDLLNASQNTDPLERLQFNRVAYRLTSLMVSLGHLQINQFAHGVTAQALQ